MQLAQKSEGHICYVLAHGTVVALLRPLNRMWQRMWLNRPLSQPELEVPETKALIEDAMIDAPVVVEKVETVSKSAAPKRKFWLFRNAFY